MDFEQIKAWRAQAKAGAPPGTVPGTDADDLDWLIAEVERLRKLVVDAVEKMCHVDHEGAFDLLNQASSEWLTHHADAASTVTLDPEVPSAK